MGGLLGNLTNSGTALQDASGNTAVGNPNQVLNAADNALKAKTQASQLSNLSGSPDAMTTGQGQLPTITKPSFMQAATAGATPGAGNATSPGLNKAGKLAVVLQSGLQGAMAGHAASENAIAQSGGRRSGGAGMGFEAAQNYPWQRAGMQEQLAQQQAQTGLLQSEAQTVNVPGIGPMPGWLAKAMGPAGLRAQAEQEAAKTRAGATEQAATTRAGAQVQGAQIGAASRTGAAQIGANARVKAAELGLGPIAQVPQELQDQLGLPAELPIKMLNQAESAANRPLTTVAGENDTYLINKQTGGKTPLGVGSRSIGAMMARPVQVGDPNNPGNTTYTTAGNAIKTGAAGTQSASVQVPRAAARAEVPTKIGDQRIAFTTMIQHAELLRDAAKALNNGDVQTLSGLKNAFRNEFGYSGPITAKAIADAYGGEVTNVISKGHITDAEMAKTGKTLDPSKQNFATVNNVLNAYQALAQSKMKMLDQQEQLAIQKSQPKSSTAPSSNDLVNQLIQKHAPTASATARQ